ncbi:hypothetical protein Acr_08g0011240 [Actinidia rufa]|uniref:Uncharacterized protein n=1 Tax=Actinidia rufa TaxID=165716 RepID=A0A7J0F207_9ERIC|nr:hypothetical protein Acr_08g0011240 [Actinidia rufa]
MKPTIPLPGDEAGVYRTPNTFLDAKKRDEMDIPDPIPKRCGVSRGHNTAWVSSLSCRLKWKVRQRDVAPDYDVSPLEVGVELMLGQRVWVRHMAGYPSFNQQ